MPVYGKPAPVPAGVPHPRPPCADGERSSGDGTPAATGSSPASMAGLPTSRGEPPPTAPPPLVAPPSSSKSDAASRLGGDASVGPNISSPPRGMGDRHRQLEGGHGGAAGDSPPPAEASVAATAGTTASSSTTRGRADDFGDIVASGREPTPTAVASGDDDRAAVASGAATEPSGVVSMEAVNEDGPGLQCFGASSLCCPGSLSFLGL